MSTNPSGRNPRTEAELLRLFGPIDDPPKFSSEPCTILDKDGNILLWYLPRALTQSRVVGWHMTKLKYDIDFCHQGQIFKSLQIIERSFSVKKMSSSWRDGPMLYDSIPGWYKPGTLSLSPAWFQQGHSVRLSFRM